MATDYPEKILVLLLLYPSLAKFSAVVLLTDVICSTSFEMAADLIRVGRLAILEVVDCTADALSMDP